MANERDEIRAQPARNEMRAWMTVATLTLLYGFGTLDRQMLSLLVLPIKADLGLSDVQIGLLQGAAFSLFFVLASLPIGWLVDHASRRAVLFFGTIVWSLCAAGSGLTRGFGEMFAARAGVGAGEAALQPVAFATLADLFPAERLSLPMSIFVVGASVGSGFSFIFGGMIVEWAATHGQAHLPLVGPLESWRVAFLVTGLPGLLLAVIAFAIPRTVRAPRAAGDHSRGFAEAFRHYRGHLAFYLFHNLAFASCIAMVVSLLAWNPTFLARHYGWTAGPIGLWLGTTQIGASLLALAFHGWAVDRMFRRGVRDAHLRWFAIMCPLAGLLCAAAYVVDDVRLMLLLFNLGLFCVIGYPGVAAAALQIATPPALRGRISAMYLIGLNLLGALSGPVLVAAITQYWFRNEARIGWSMSLTALVLMVSAGVCCVAGLKPMRAALAARNG